MTQHELPATPATVHWGCFDASLAPVLTVRSGDLARIEALTHHAGDTLQVDILEAQPRLGYGSNFAGHWTRTRS